MNTRRRAKLRAWCIALGVACFSCGYHSLKTTAPAARVGVALTKNLTANSRAASDVVAGTMAALAKEGMLRNGSAYPRVEIEVLRVDESPTGITVSAGHPTARGHEVAVVARGSIREREGATPLRDTGDIRAAVLVAREGTLSEAETSLEAAVSAAARRAGRIIGESIAGHPIGSDDEGL